MVVRHPPNLHSQLDRRKALSRKVAEVTVSLPEEAAVEFTSQESVQEERAAQE